MGEYWHCVLGDPLRRTRTSRSLRPCQFIPQLDRCKHSILICCVFPFSILFLLQTNTILNKQFFKERKTRICIKNSIVWFPLPCFADVFYGRHFTLIRIMFLNSRKFAHFFHPRPLAAGWFLHMCVCSCANDERQRCVFSFIVIVRVLFSSSETLQQNSTFE